MSRKYLHFRVPLVGYCRIIQRTFRYYQLNYKLINVMNQQFLKKEHDMENSKLFIQAIEFVKQSKLDAKMAF